LEIASTLVLAAAKVNKNSDYFSLFKLIAFKSSLETPILDAVKRFVDHFEKQSELAEAEDEKNNLLLQPFRLILRIIVDEFNKEAADNNACSIKLQVKLMLCI